MNIPGPSSTTFAGLACGVVAAIFWALSFVAVRHGLDAGFAAPDIVLHRFIWSAIFLLPLFIRNGVASLNGIGWTHGIILTVLGGPAFAMLSYSGFLLVPLGHGSVIQPSCAALSGLLLATLVLKEHLPPQRALGALIIILGLLAIGGEAVTTIGTHGVVGDLMFVLAGTMFGTFGMLLRLWRVDALRATVVVGVLSAVFLPIYAATTGFGRIVALGWSENLIQAVAQGILAGPGAIYLFVRSVQLLGVGRASAFPSLVPGLTLLFGFLILREVPSVMQLAGFAVVLVGFRLAQRA